MKHLHLLEDIEADGLIAVRTGFVVGVYLVLDSVRTEVLRIRPLGDVDERAQVRCQLVEIILAVEEAVESEGRQFGEPIRVVGVVEVSELVSHRPHETDRRETLDDERVYVGALVPCGDGGEAKAAVIRQTELAALVHVRTAQAGHCAEVRIESPTAGDAATLYLLKGHPEGSEEVPQPIAAEARRGVGQKVRHSVECTDELFQLDSVARGDVIGAGPVRHDEVYF